MAEMKSLTLNGTTYDSFVDKEARENANINVTATPGQTIRVKEVDANGKPTAWESADYQEKICGEGEIFLVENADIEFVFSEEAEAFVGCTPTVKEFEDGKTYKVIYNGVTYENQFNAEFGMLGNFGAIDESFPNTGEPYLMQTSSGELIVLPLEEITSATVSVSTVDIITIDKKLLPPDVQFTKKGDEFAVKRFNIFTFLRDNSFDPTDYKNKGKTETDLSVEVFERLWELAESNVEPYDNSRLCYGLSQVAVVNGEREARFYLGYIKYSAAINFYLDNTNKVFIDYMYNAFEETIATREIDMVINERLIKLGLIDEIPAT